MRSLCGHRGSWGGWPLPWLVAGAAIFIAACGASGCGGPDLTHAPAVLKLSHTELEFPTTFIGHPTHLDLRVTNGGRAEARYEVVGVQGPFTAKPGGPQRIPGTDTQVVEVTFHPDSPGWHVGHLDLILQDDPVRVALRGEARVAPPCESTPCVRATFDPTTGECNREVRPDGVPCESDNKCLVDTVCLGGVCQGSERICEPRNACFQAVCNAAVGCEEYPRNECKQPENPCKEAICDLETGECIVVDRPDYTSCGPNDCKEQHVCLSGVCTRIEGETEGKLCAHACGQGGICKNRECWRPEGKLLSESWTRELPGRQPGFATAVDRSGYLYWAECPDGEPCSVVSASPNGFERFRHSLLPQTGRDPKLLQEGNQIVAWTSAGIETLLTRGDPGWARSAEDLASEAGLSCPCGAEVVDLVDAGGGELVALLRWNGGTGLLWISAREGKAGPLSAIAGEPQPALASDGEGRVLSIEVDEEKTRLVARRQGAIDWSVEVDPTARILAALPSHVFLARSGSLEARVATNGSSSWTRPFEPLDLVVSNQHLFVLEQPGPRIVVLDFADGEERASYPMDGPAATSTLALKAEDRVVLLVQRQEPVETWWLEEIDAKGERAYACELPEIHPGRSWAFVRADGGGEDARLVLSDGDASIRTFFAPRLAPPPWGWTAERGSFARSGRPRQ